MIKKILNQVKINKKRFNIKNLGTQTTPRLSVFKSNKHIYLQLINDKIGHTICATSSLKLKKSLNKNNCFLIGQELNKEAFTLNIKSAIFPYSNYLYHGKISSVLSGLRNNNFLI